MSDFASELKAARGTIEQATPNAVASEAASEAPVTDVPTDGLADHMAEAHDFAGGLPVGSKAVEQAVADAAPRAPDVADEIPKIKIAGKEFSSLEEAIKYADELEIARREQEAYIEGVKMAQAKPEPTVEVVPKSYLEEAEEVLFEDPKKALKIIEEGVTKKIFDAYDKMTGEQKQQAQAQAQKQQLWDNFYSENGDLAESKEYVEFMLNRNPDLLKKTASEALKELADISRKGLRISKQAALPRTELPSKPAITAGASMGATGGQQVVTEPAQVDFVTALKQLRKRK